MQRRLAAILAADMVGYSRLMAEDEAGTLARLKALRTDVIDPEITRHGGRIVKLMGDGVVGQFEIYFSRSLKVATSLGLSSGRTVARRFPGFVGPSISGPPQTSSAACSLSCASTLRGSSSDFPPA